MVTSVIMNRSMGNYKVYQRTKDGYFDGNYLISQWNKLNNKRRRINDFLESKNTSEFISVLQDEISNDEISPMAFYHKKGRNTSKGKTKDEVWMHPYLFIDFAMWINPKFKLKVIQFVYDELIKNRHIAGDNYKMLSQSGIKLKGYNFSEVATAMNWIVFGKRGKNLRQNATNDQLKELSEIEHKLSFIIDMGYVKNYKHLLSEMRKMYRIKNNKTPF